MSHQARTDEPTTPSRTTPTGRHGRTSEGNDDKSPGILEKVLVEIRAGLVSSIIAEAALFPLDVIKLRQQVHGGAATDVLRQVIRERGVLGLYQGLLGRLIQTVTSNVGFFIWQTIFMQAAAKRMTDQVTSEGAPRLGTGASLVLNMLAQQVNRLLTTPVDVVANVNQTDPNSKGFFHTFLKLAQTGGRATLWRGIDVALLLSFNPALMFTLVGKLTAALAAYRGDDSLELKTADMFWISGVSKTVATLLTYPLIRAKALMQSVDGAPTQLWGTLTSIAKKDGFAGLYQGVLILSYKTVMFNSMMMALKQKLTSLEKNRALIRRSLLANGELRQRVALIRSEVPPWSAALQGNTVVYIDGSWTFLHKAQQHVLQKASDRGDYLVVGVHSDEVHKQAMGSYPKECFAERLQRLREHPLVSCVLEDAPWEVDEGVVRQLGISKVVSGSVGKIGDCAANPNEAKVQLQDPYEDCKRMGIFEVVQSLDDTTEHSVWLDNTRKILFSNVDASIDWRILVRDEPTSKWGGNPGYTPQAEAATSSTEHRARTTIC